jgi:hypothetical protein
MQRVMLGLVVGREIVKFQDFVIRGGCTGRLFHYGGGVLFVPRFFYFELPSFHFIP